MSEELVEKVAHAIEDRTIELQGEGKYLVTGYNDSVEFARAVIPVVLEEAAKVAEGCQEINRAVTNEVANRIAKRIRNLGSR